MWSVCVGDLVVIGESLCWMSQEKAKGFVETEAGQVQEWFSVASTSRFRCLIP